MISEYEQVSLVAPRRGLQQDLVSPSRTQDWSTFGRGFLGLTQANRQVRAEVFSLCDEHLDVELLLDGLEDYTSCIASGIRYRSVCITPSPSSSIDIKPLSMIAVRSPLRLLSWTSYILDALLRPDELPGWLDYLEKGASRLMVLTDKYGFPNRRSVLYPKTALPIHIFIKKEYAERWMETGEGIDAGSEVKRAWLARFCLDKYSDEVEVSID